MSRGDDPLTPASYTRWRASRVGEVTERLERNLVLDLIGDVHEARVLDVGCGDGSLACELARRGATVQGIDVSLAMIDAARRGAATERLDVGFAVADARTLPFATGAFDVVAAVTILCFVRDAAAVFREMARVLRPGGRLVIGELGKWSSWAATRRVRGWLGSPLWRQGRFRTASELRRLARESGFDVETVRGAVYYPRCTAAAVAMAPFDARLAALGTLGAAFVALRARRAP